VAFGVMPFAAIAFILFNAFRCQRCVAHAVCSGIADPAVCSPEERSIDHAVLLVR
jgi:hypothetical protein